MTDSGQAEARGRSPEVLDCAQAVRAVSDLLDGMNSGSRARKARVADHGLPLPLDVLNRNLRRIRLRHGYDLPGRFWNASVRRGAANGGSASVRFPLYWLEYDGGLAVDFHLGCVREFHLRRGTSDFVLVTDDSSDSGRELVFGLMEPTRAGGTDGGGPDTANPGIGTINRDGSCALLQAPHPDSPCVWITSLTSGEAGEADGGDEESGGAENPMPNVPDGIRARRPLMIVDRPAALSAGALEGLSAFDPLAIVVIGPDRPERFNFVAKCDLTSGGGKRIPRPVASPRRPERRSRPEPPPISFAFRILTLIAVLGLIVEPPLVVLAMARRGVIPMVWSDAPESRRGVMLGVYQTDASGATEPLWARRVVGGEGAVIGNAAILSAVPGDLLERLKSADSKLVLRVAGRFQARRTGEYQFRLHGNVDMRLYLNGEMIATLDAAGKQQPSETDAPAVKLAGGMNYLAADISGLGDKAVFLVMSGFGDARPAPMWLAAFHADPIPGESK